MNNKKVFIVAELSANHNNDFNLAVKTVEAMAKSGADAVKVQTYTADSLSLDMHNKYFGPIKKGLWREVRPYELYKRAAMPWEWQPKLKKITEGLGMTFFSSPFDLEAVDFLEKLDIDLYKVASFEITDTPLIKRIAKIGKPIIFSTGLAETADIKLALDSCREERNKQVTLLKCTSQYPADISDANLLTIPDMAKRFGVNVGVSDHSEGFMVPVVATALGGKVVEKHFILDRSIGGPDAAFSMEPNEFKYMVEQVRKTEKALGKVTYEVSEKDKLRRRSLFAVCDIAKGEVISELNIKSLRPGHGLHPRYLDSIFGRKATKDIRKGAPLKRDMVSGA